MVISTGRRGQVFDFQAVRPGPQRRELAPVIRLDLSPTQKALFDAGRRVGLHEGWDMAHGFLEVDPILLADAPDASGEDAGPPPIAIRAAAGIR